MHWSADYVGLPWRARGLTREGIACWGLARLVYAEQLGIEVPDYAAAVSSLTERAEVAAVFAENTSAAGPWVEVHAAGAQFEIVQDFDILVFQRAGLTHHVGIAIGGGRMLHIDTDQDSCLVDFTTGRWASRLVGAYRHKARILDPVMEAA
ncbi:NlpC/P60 family protein [Methylobacterium sp. 77]|uniref:NlpC/P60 family protein n=1 Tax=Methylobacterium sp. 77 TaxID=1101192 RepID=UPI00036C263B|nr:NlpC/P60 family protein [Methylobacterium sp. 77]